MNRVSCELQNGIPDSIREQIMLGNQHAFRQLYDYYSKKLMQFALGLVKTKDPAIEIIDEVFVNLWKNRQRINQIQNLKVYLYTATKNTALNYLSRKAHQQITEPFDYINIQMRDEQCPEQAFITSEIFKKIQSAIEELPPRCKMIFKLIREDGLKYKEVAEVLNLSVNTVDAQMVIAVKKISQKVKAHFDFFPQPAEKKSEKF